MPKDSLILIHTPSVFDFRERPTLWGPISDLVPSNPVFDMYPIGFITIAEHLERHGYRVRIVNLAVRMLRDPEFEVEKFIGRLNSSAFGIDLHWLPHAHGSIEIARHIKRIHPQTPVIFGGISSSYFHEELIGYHQIDYVLRGDSTEEPLRQLIECIETGSQSSDLRRIPNLTWKDKKGIPQINPLSYVPDNLDNVIIDYSYPIQAAVRELNLKNFLPFNNWIKYPITAALTCRGCTHNCTICGGSKYAFQLFMGRSRPAFRNPDILAQDIRRISRFSRGPVFVLGDIRQAGMMYAKRFLKSLQGIKNLVILEFFWPVDREFMEMIAGTVPDFVAQLSPESHDPKVRSYTNNPFSEHSIETSIKHILSVGCRRIDVFFMSGLPGQTYRSVMDSIEYCQQLYHTFDGDNRLMFYLSPLAPFLDPGSLAYEKPAQYGYKRFCNTLEDHRRALLAPSWKYVLSYETRWMNRSEIVGSTYQAALLLNRYKLKFGQISREHAQSIEERTRRAIELMSFIDRSMATKNSDELLQIMLKHKSRIEEVNNSTICDKKELELPVGRVPFRILKTAGLVLEESIKNIGRKIGSFQ